MGGPLHTDADVVAIALAIAPLVVLLSSGRGIFEGILMGVAVHVFCPASSEDHERRRGPPPSRSSHVKITAGLAAWRAESDIAGEGGIVFRWDGGEEGNVIAATCGRVSVVAAEAFGDGNELPRGRAGAFGLNGGDEVGDAFPYRIVAEGCPSTTSCTTFS
jgi:hypothetical protein